MRPTPRPSLGSRWRKWLAGLLAWSFLALQTVAGFAVELPTYLEGEIAWPCWGESQQIVLTIGQYKDVGGGIFRASGIELYRVHNRYRSIAVELEVDVERHVFKLSEQYPGTRLYETPIWDGVYEGRLLEGTRVLSSVRKDIGELCVPDIVLVETEARVP